MEYGDKYPKVMDVITSVFGWCNLSVFSFVGMTCKVRCCVPVARVLMCAFSVVTDQVVVRFTTFVLRRLPALTSSID